MIFVQGWIKLVPQDVEKILPIARDMVAATLKEEGCIHYSFAQDVSEPSLIHISERWRGEDELNAHFQTSHMASFNEAANEMTIEHMDVRMFSGEEVRVMMQS